MRYPPTMEDMALLAQIGLDEPPETSLRLVLLHRELQECVVTRPADMVAFCMAIEQNRSQLDRQLRCAMGMLAERAEEVQALREHLVEARAAALSDEESAQRWRWFRPRPRS